MAPHKIDDEKTLENAFLQPFAFSKSLNTNATTFQDVEPFESLENIAQLLIRASQFDRGLIFCSKDQGIKVRYSYAQLLEDAQAKSLLLQQIHGLRPSMVILLHFDTQLESILWFWATTLAGCIPAISTPFVNDHVQRKKHLIHLHSLLNEPVVLTSARLVPEFLGIEELSIHAVESFQNDRLPAPPTSRLYEKQNGDIAVLMLTSGSTGNAKAVPLRHGQLLTAVKGKSEHHGTNPGDTFLNWVGLDHVASLTEIHLHAMSLYGEVVHVEAADVLNDPLYFIRLLDEHKTVYTFAPNFFLTMVRDRIIAENSSIMADLSRLRALISGGESNVVATCDALTQELRQFGVQGEIIRPGFGMTETCAGSIYSRSCPSYDLSRGHEFASLGQCIPGLDMRIMKSTGNRAMPGETGDLQLSGSVLFDHYFNNPDATKESFTEDGWFITGDIAYIDEYGNLNLTGRSKDTIIVNGVKWSSTEIETAIGEEGIPGVIPSYIVAFPHRVTNSPTEDICVVYSPSYEPNDNCARFETSAAISKTISLITGKKPDILIPLPRNLLEKSTLGKISRTKVRAAFESGDYEAHSQENAKALERHHNSTWEEAKTTTERTLQKVLSDILGMPTVNIGLRASIFDLGITSFNLITLKARLQDALEADVEIPMSVLLIDPTVGAISKSVDDLLSQPQIYNPIVPLQLHGSKTPIFCIHPGSGDILVFIALAAHFPTRPVYAIRTRGYNPNESFFASIKETAVTYARHIRKTQPEGPYAIAGYSLGSTLAYEVGKELEAQGEAVKFLASIDYPPHIRHYVQNLDWIDVLLHIAFFLELIDEPTMVEITPTLHKLDRVSALQYILDIGDKARMNALAIDSKKLELISDIAENFRVNVETYEPTGSVESLDVFVADPPTYAAKGRADWRDNKLGRWKDFSRVGTVFHDCPGIHAKMLNSEHITEFARIFKAAMKRRGI